MNQIHLHYTHFPNRHYYSVSAIGLTTEQLKNYAKRAGFFVINCSGETQRFITRKIKCKVSLFVALENAGYVVFTSHDNREILPPIPATEPESRTAKTWLGDEGWYCGLGGAA